MNFESSIANSISVCNHNADLIISLKQREYLAFAILLGCVGLNTALNEHVAMFDRLNRPSGRVVLMCGIMISALFFARSFLKTERFPRYHRGTIYILYGIIASGLLDLILQTPTVTPMLVFVE